MSGIKKVKDSKEDSNFWLKELNNDNVTFMVNFMCQPDLAKGYRKS